MPASSLYRRVKRRFSFDLPAEYKQMQDRGWLTLDRPAASISTMPGDGYLYLCDMEWYSLEEIASFEFPDHCQPHLQCLVPFAFTGSGDSWCWQTDASDQRGTRVLLCMHDSYLATVYAPNFAAALYRQALQYASTWVDGKVVSFTEARAYLRRWSVDLALVLPAKWCGVLAELAERVPFEWSHNFGHYTARGTSLLSPEEVRQIETRDLQFESLDTDIQWTGFK